jgi:hypothetical protein
MMVRRLAFPVILMLFLVGLGAMLYLSPEFGVEGQTFRQLIGLEPASSPSTTAPGRGSATSPDANRPSDANLGSGAMGQNPMPGRSGMGGASAGSLAAGRSGSSDALGTGYADLSVYSEPPGATVLVDGDSVGTTPLNRYSVRSGVYIITVERDGFFSADTVAVLRNNQAPTYAVTLNARPELPAEDRVADRDVTSPPSTGNTPPTSTGSTAEDDAPPAQPVEPAPTTGTLRLTSNPSGAQVMLDGTAVGTTPLTLESLEAGAYEVAFSRSGYDTSQMSVTVSPGEERRVEAALSPQMGQLRVLARPWGSIYVNGELRERNADVWYQMSIPAGEHEVSVVHPALGQQTRTVTVEAGEQLSIVIDLRDSSSSASQNGSAQPDSTNRSGRLF